MINTDKIENGYTKSCWNLARTKARFALDGYTVRTDRVECPAWRGIGMTLEAQKGDVIKLVVNGGMVRW
jgi:hypothetical protein